MYKEKGTSRVDEKLVLYLLAPAGGMWWKKTGRSGGVEYTTTGEVECTRKFWEWPPKWNTGRMRFM